MNIEQVDDVFWNRVDVVGEALLDISEAMGPCDDYLKTYRDSGHEGVSLREKVWNQSVVPAWDTLYRATAGCVKAGAVLTPDEIAALLNPMYVALTELEVAFVEADTKRNTLVNKAMEELAATVGAVTNSGCCFCGGSEPEETEAPTSVNVMVPPVLVVKGVEQGKEFADKLIALFTQYDVDGVLKKAA